MFKPYQIVERNGKWCILVWVYNSACWFPWIQKYLTPTSYPTSKLSDALTFEYKIDAEQFVNQLYINSIPKDS